MATTETFTGIVLRDRTAIVTGAGSGVGRQLALAFACEGARVACVGRRAATLEETAAQIRAAGGEGYALAADITDPAQVQGMTAAVMARHGSIDLLFNNAGSFRSIGPLWEADPETWWNDVTVNLRGAMLCCHAVLPHMMARRRGVILNMDGGGGGCGPDIVACRLGLPDTPRFNGPNVAGSAYGASKAALMRLTEGLARELELAGSPVLVLGFNPGFVRTAMTEGIAAAPAGAQWQPFVARLLAGQADRPASDCADATLRLLRVVGPELNGCVFDVDTDFAAVARERYRLRSDELYVMRLRDPRAERALATL